MPCEGLGGVYSIRADKPRGCVRGAWALALHPPPLWRLMFSGFGVGRASICPLGWLVAGRGWRRATPHPVAYRQR